MATLRSIGCTVRPAVGALRAGLRTPTALYSPSYGKPDKTQAYRTYQTIQGLAGRLGLRVQSPVPEGQEPALAEAILGSGGEAVLICWEHQHIPALAHASPSSTPQPFPPSGRANGSTSSGLSPSMLLTDATRSTKCPNNFWRTTPTPSSDPAGAVGSAEDAGPHRKGTGCAL